MEETVHKKAEFPLRHAPASNCSLTKSFIPVLSFCRLSPPPIMFKVILLVLAFIAASALAHTAPPSSLVCNKPGTTKGLPALPPAHFLSTPCTIPDALDQI